VVSQAVYRVLLARGCAEQSKRASNKLRLSWYTTGPNHDHPCWYSCVARLRETAPIHLRYEYVLIDAVSQPLQPRYEGLISSYSNAGRRRSRSRNATFPRRGFPSIDSYQHKRNSLPTSHVRSTIRRRQFNIFVVVFVNDRRSSCSCEQSRI